MTATAPRRRPRREDVRSSLQSAALVVFQEQGYQAARLDDIADRAGYTKGAVYSNFGSKQELFASLLTARLTGIADDILSGTRQQASLDALVHYTATRLADEIVEERAWHILVVEFMIQAGRDASVRELIRGQQAQRRVVLAEGIAEHAQNFGGSGDPDSYVAFATVVLAAVNGLAVELAADPDSVSTAQIVTALEALLRAALTG